MLSRKCFDRCIGTLLFFAQTEIDEKKNDMFYQLLCNDFEDKEFSEICGDICRTENLFGRYPIPKMFYDRQVCLDNDDECLLEKQAFLDKVIRYLDSYYISDEYKSAFENSLTENEFRCLMANGGISELYYVTHRDFNPRSIDSVLSELDKRFSETYQVMGKIKHLGERTKLSEKMQNLISPSIKKILG